MKKLLLIIIVFCFACAANAQTFTCPTCSGAGAVVCPACGGVGATLTMFGWAPCFGCGGARFIPCGVCYGNGSITYMGAPPVPFSAVPPVPSFSEESNDRPSPSPSNTIQKTCPYCSGKGETIQHESVATFGLDGPKTYCAKCNQSWSYGTVHAHHTCRHCDGTGYKTY